MPHVLKNGNEFDRGYMAALATVLNGHRDSKMVEDALGHNLLSVHQMRKIGVDEYDIRLLRPIVREINRKKRLKQSKHQ